MPLVITDVLVMLFGKVDVESMETIVKSSDTYALAAERAGTIEKNMNKTGFTATPQDKDVKSKDRVEVAHLVTDDSNKVVDLTAMPYFARFGDDVVRERALLTKQAISHV